MLYEEFFQTTFGYKPRRYQERVKDEVLAGKNVVLVAPTGAGKTMAALAPFFYAKQMGRPIADRVLYALPLRSLASALHASISEHFPDEQNPKITIQMGNQPDDPFFEGDVVFTTIDQLLSAYVGLPYGTSKASANIPPGALIGALVVIDEFHLLSYGEALPTFLDMMKRLHPYTQFLVMTATVPKQNVEKIRGVLQGEALDLNPEERKELPQQTRALTWHDTPLTAELVLEQARKKTLVVVNTVARAQQLFLDLQNILQEQGKTLEMRCLHSRLFGSGRYETEEWVLKRFKKGAEEHALLIATQVVEAGLDISSDVLLTDLCPANALLQRIGRCARYHNEEGHVHVFSVDEQYRPYEKDLMKMTSAFLSRQETIVLQSEWEHDLIEFVHGEYDAAKMQDTLHLLPDRKKEINDAHVNGEPDTSKLVRSIDSVSVMIHPEPSSLRLELRPERISVSFQMVFHHLKAHEGKSDPVGWYPDFEENSWGRAVPIWKELTKAGDLMGQRLICLSPKYVHYHEEVGLLFTPTEDGVGVFSKETRTEPERTGERFDYFRETYLEHVTRIRALYQEEEKEGVHQVADAKLIRHLSLPPAVSPAKLAEFTGALHDIGKLTLQFQKALQDWQHDTRGIKEKDLLAHTDYIGSSLEDRKAAKLSKYQRPPHSVEGSILAIPLLSQMAQQGETEQHGLLFETMVLAIMRHHHAFSKECKCKDKFVVANGTKAVVRESLAGLFEGKMELVETKSSHEYEYYRDLSDPDLLVLYWYLVRRLRLNDRLSQERLAEEKRKEGERIHGD
ncbi:CRISPR-associated helicase Cas3' [Tumebacillus flagellatus]|uniref:CRISPR-associated protein Cas3 n=1 Tax=Tumebacillus flagellatus TaxID=1157490 RepID=A0A074LUC3_9BACL|nr:CRISPR-associated helicase Cas3' [Tumebacillus flagellatus]KEO83528.1 hypothetical protein EL26_08925 [Tumebacillus flagellatus]